MLDNVPVVKFGFFLSFLCELSQTVVCHFLFICQVEMLCLTVLSVR